MPSEPMTDEELERFEDSRDFHTDLLQSIREMKSGLGTVVYPPVLAARNSSGLSQSQFAELMGVSVRTLQEWEQGRRQPSGAARTLLRVAERHPDVLRELAA
ncbi:putative transcriptional regulator [Gammaproteobacteria bacterium]